jgi:putative oxidoreductase
MTPTLLVYSEYGLLVLRIVLATILIAHGIPKVRHASEAAEQFHALGARPARALVALATLIEIVGGALLLVGLFTQIVALIVALQFLVIVVYIKRHDRRLVGGYEFDLLVLAGALVLMTSGAGAWSIDSFLRVILF